MRCTIIKADTRMSQSSFLRQCVFVSSSLTLIADSDLFFSDLCLFPRLYLFMAQQLTKGWWALRPPSESILSTWTQKCILGSQINSHN